MMTAIILAAGLSRRMGTVNKLLLPFGNKTILETTLDNILSSNIDSVMIVVGHEAEQIKLLLAQYLEKNSTVHHEFYIIENPDFEQGLTGSIQAGIKSLHALNLSERGYMICLSDMPLISSEEYSYLINQFNRHLRNDEQAIVQPMFKKRRGNPTLFAAFYKDDILKLTDTEGCKPIVQAYKNHVYLVDMPTDAVLKDIDNTEDYQLING